MISQISQAEYWHKLADGRIQCDLCPHRCKLHEGQRGLCFVRMRQGEELVSTVYGHSSGFGIDPIEKKPFNHFFPGSQVFSFGTIGCNLTCKFCQNWHISQEQQVNELYDIDPKSVAAAACEHHCPSVAFTYNEPTVFIEYVLAVAKECRDLGIKTVAVTNGYICSEPRHDFFSHMDAVNIDLKGFSEEFYKKMAGGHLAPVLETLRYLKQHTKVWLELTTLLLAGENDSVTELENATTWIRENLGEEVPLHFTAFYPAWKLHTLPPTSLDTLVRARTIALRNGLRYVYIGNLYYPTGNHTWCHQCNQQIIGRIGHEVTSYNLDESGCCNFCGAKCAGVFA